MGEGICTLVLILFILFYWSIVYVNYIVLVSEVKWFRFFFHSVHYKLLQNIKYTYLCYKNFPFGKRKFVFYESVSILYIDSFLWFLDYTYM